MGLKLMLDQRISLCCPRLRTKCPTVVKSGENISIEVPPEDMADYIEELNGGGIKLTLHEEQVKLLLKICQ